MVKPFSPGELVARVEAVLRRIEPVPERQPRMQFDGLEIDPTARRSPSTAGGSSSPSSSSSFSSSSHDIQVRYSRASSLWITCGSTRFYLDTSTVTVHIRRLRAKLEPDPARPRFIQTIWGVGYRFEP